MAACLAIDNRVAVQQIDVPQLQALLKTNPLADGSTPEILVDNDDTTSVIIKGNWAHKANFSGCYGPSLLMNEHPQPDDYVTFTPAIVKEGDYNVYTYIVKAPGAASAINIVVNDGVQDKTIVLKTADIVVNGQTEGEWVSMGKFPFKAGRDSSVTIGGKNADGNVLADAVLFIPERN